MNWLNIEIKTLTSSEFLGSDPIERATWLCLLRYCAQQENGGIIKDCFSWKDRKWMQLSGVICDEVKTKSSLWKWKENDLIVWNYPIEKELEVIANRENGKKGGRPRKSKTKPCGYELEKPSGSKSVKRKGKERKGKEEEKEKNKKESFDFCWSLFGSYGNKQKASRYWMRLSEKDQKNIKSRIPIYLQYLKDTGVSKKMFDGWINPENRIWETTYENLSVKKQNHNADMSFMLAADEEL